MELPTFRTPRLLLRPLTLDDAAAAQPLFAHWEIVKHLNAQVPWPYPPDGVLTYYRDYALPAMARGDEWHWAICLPPTATRSETFIGAIGLFRTIDDNPANRGFWIGLPYQGHGYASEACATITRFWFKILGFDELIVLKAVASAASRRISERTGMTILRAEARPFVGGILPAEVWRLTREQWLRRQTG